MIHVCQLIQLLEPIALDINKADNQWSISSKTWMFPVKNSWYFIAKESMLWKTEAPTKAGCFGWVVHLWGASPELLLSSTNSRNCIIIRSTWLHVCLGNLIVVEFETYTRHRSLVGWQRKLVCKSISVLL